MLQKKVLYAGPKCFEKLKPEPGGPEKPCQRFNSAPCQKSHSKSSTCIMTQKTIFEIKSKCTMVNWQKSTKFHL